MKISTWNVNGIRARGAQLCEWLERDRPDVVCLQKLKATPEQVPEPCKLSDYHAYWHGARAYSGVSLHVKKAAGGSTTSLHLKRSPLARKAASCWPTSARATTRRW